MAYLLIFTAYSNCQCGLDKLVDQTMPARLDLQGAYFSEDFLCKKSLNPVVVSYIGLGCSISRIVLVL